jgi:serine/threonine protein kinase
MTTTQTDIFLQNIPYRKQSPIRRSPTAKIVPAIIPTYNAADFRGYSNRIAIGSLEITALLDKGGMGEVYRARDTKLKRDVAIKTLPDEFGSRPSPEERNL